MNNNTSHKFKVIIRTWLKGKIFTSTYYLKDYQLGLSFYTEAHNELKQQSIHYEIRLINLQTNNITKQKRNW